VPGTGAFLGGRGGSGAGKGEEFSDGRAFEACSGLRECNRTPPPPRRDAIGLGAGMAHPRESEEWKAMTMRERYEFFAPIWRVMRDDNMTADDVAEQARRDGG
jgi:hypothetical protein